MEQAGSRARDQLTAASIERTNRNGVSQTIHYDEGVGTTELGKARDGVLGHGLLENLREAYRFLILNGRPTI